MPELHTSTDAAAAAATATTAATTSTLLAESSEQPSQQQNNPPNSNPFLNIFSDLLKLLNFFPLPQKKQGEEESAASEARQATKVSPVVDEVEAEAKAIVVRFPRHKDENLPSLKLEPDVIEERNTNPVVLWQVYAIGGLLVLRWAWTRWNERRTRKKPSNGEPPPALD